MANIISSCVAIFLLSWVLKCASFDLTPKSMDFETYYNWLKLSIDEKIPYLLDRFQIQNFEQEYTEFISCGNECTFDHDFHNGSELSLNKLREQLAEFQSPEIILSYFEQCDRNRSGGIDFMEYVICRGSNSKYGTPSDVSEFDFAENVVLQDFVTKFINNPNVRNPMYKYDEDGIIID